MDFSLRDLPEILKLFLTVVSGLTALLPPWFWGKIEPTRAERALFGAFAAATVFFLWPIDLSYCGKVSLYLWIGVALLVWFLLALAVDAIILRQFCYSQHIREDDLKTTKPILGGPRLTPAARELQHRESRMSIQEIFESFDCDPLRTWERWPRTLITILQRFAALSKVFALVLAIASFIAYFVLVKEINRAHRALSLEPSSDPVLLARSSIDIKANLQECNPDVRWEIEGLSAAKATGALGEVSPKGTYSSPMQVDRDIELYVVATPAQHPYEFKKLKIQLRAQPKDSEVYHVETEDSGGREARFDIQVIDQRFSWIIGKYDLNGETGPAFTRRMAAAGMFNGFEDIICVGAASREYKSLSDEDDRALKRANVLAHWVSSAVPHSRARIYALKIGRYNDEGRLTSAETARERQVVFVGVKPGSEKNVDVLDALRKAFVEKRKEEPLFGMYLDKYPFHNWELRELTEKM